MFTRNSQVSIYLWITQPPTPPIFLVVASKENLILINNWVTYLFVIETLDTKVGYWSPECSCDSHWENHLSSRAERRADQLGQLTSSHGTCPPRLFLRSSHHICFGMSLTFCRGHCLCFPAGWTAYQMARTNKVQCQMTPGSIQVP